jgi:hypothetical protein
VACIVTSKSRAVRISRRTAVVSPTPIAAPYGAAARTDSLWLDEDPGG